ncbi:MAG: ABC transporter permease subunit, partial [Psychromonas sp.]
MLNRETQDRLLLAATWAAASITIMFLLWVVWHILSNGLSHVSWEFVTGAYTRIGQASGIWAMIVTTIYMVLLTLAIATPIGIMTAIYLTEYAKPGSKIVQVIRFCIESLAGIPSIVYGLFGMTFFVTTLGLGFSILSGALTLSVLILPVIIRTTEEALMAVPMSYREGGYA